MTQHHLAARMQKLKPSATILLTAQAKKLRGEGKDVIILAAGEPDFETPEHVKRGGIEAIEQNRNRYTPADGIIELKRAVSAKLKRENHIEYSPEEIIISNGAKHSLTNAILATVGEGDEVIIPAPYWVSYIAQVELAGGREVIASAKNRHKLRADDIAQCITERTKLLIINSPNNPTGMMIEKEELVKIAKLAEEHDFIIISDEVYEHFTYDGKKQVSIASLNDAAKHRTITINAVSKTYAMTGWRIGYAAGPKEIITAMSTLQSQMTSNPSNIAQYAAIAALSGPQESVSVMRNAFDERRRFVVDALNEMPGMKCATPEGAFYAFADITGLLGDGTGIPDDTAFTKRLLDEALVAIIPGSEFGAPGFVRISYAAGMDDLRKAMERMDRFVRSLSGAAT